MLVCLVEVGNTAGDNAYIRIPYLYQISRNSLLQSTRSHCSLIDSNRKRSATAISRRKWCSHDTHMCHVSVM